MEGIFISFEGIEGCGKSTQTRRLRDRLENNHIKVVLTREPGDGEFGSKIRDILLNASHAGLDPLAELFLLEADRTQHLKEVIRPALEEGCTVICDRYADSSMAYQGFGRGISRDLVRQLNEEATAGLEPVLTFIFDLDAGDSLARSKHRLLQQEMFDKEGRFENESIVFHQKVREGYLNIARENPHRVVLIDGTLSIDELSEVVWFHVNKRLKMSGEKCND